MYVFTSAVFFLLFFSVFKTGNISTTTINDPLTTKGRTKELIKLESDLKNDPNNEKIRSGITLLKDSSHVVTMKDLIELGAVEPSINFSSKAYKSRHEYDSIQHNLPIKKRDGWIARRWVHKQIDINEKIKENPDEALKKFIESLLHRLPYMLFISLPLFALILKLVYVRRKQFFFSDHGVFTIHLYVFSFLLLIAVFAVGKLQDLTHLDELDFVVLTLFLLLFVYLYKAMRNFYGQRRAKTFIKFLLVALLSLIMMLILFVFFLFFSAVTF